jgi:hypothetical protein
MAVVGLDEDEVALPVRQTRMPRRQKTQRDCNRQPVSGQDPQCPSPPETSDGRLTPVAEGKCCKWPVEQEAGEQEEQRYAEI